MYLAANANLTTYGAGWRLWLLALCGKLLGIHFHIEGLPFGAEWRRPADWSERGSFSAGASQARASASDYGIIGSMAPRGGGSES